MRVFAVGDECGLLTFFLSSGCFLRSFEDASLLKISENVACSWFALHYSCAVALR